MSAVNNNQPPAVIVMEEEPVHRGAPLPALPLRIQGINPAVHKIAKLRLIQQHFQKHPVRQVSQNRSNVLRRDLSEAQKAALKQTKSADDNKAVDGV